MRISTRILSVLLLGLALGGSARARADEAPVAPAGAPTAAPSPAPADSGAGAEQVNVDSIKEKYWARGDESEIGVVQNRLYSKSRKIEAGLLGGVVASDPFLTVRTLGLTAGFHFNEVFGLHFLGWKSYVSPSSALQTFQDTIGATTNNNPPRTYYGGEGSFSFLYGKLSLLGKAIIYYDMHLLADAGATATESGNFLTLGGGIGQKVYLAKSVALRVDYRLLRYNETLVEKVITPKLGQEIGSRINWSNSITLGVDILVEVFK